MSTDQWKNWLAFPNNIPIPKDYANVLVIECPNCGSYFEIFKGIYETYEELFCTKKCGEKNLKENFKVIKECKNNA